ncbi:TIGR03808 family TAT-translocated repetitive protein [Rhodoplanes sp. TEM]|uniref:TIGR03808 family TAT-translocated repetitive protein n=1 Tax=Rhodoplanes tepidamans TaxID=200616 RepID=A0ABT5JF13_RHOTP|nr:MULTISPECIES: TIGR03808 family TAT-translocated repetitive protein [Rhodoplanes]MDC7788174.1 TIGR03808 family TAT-translocated repetitive protein [Rhodoplanes tepidamans]MDC7986517.1 TIGR03808 family TAT-translocated repetitive protein [Rhodoplanes sp. TEM]MDQ0355136.1 putative secreted repeat protein (TIGR03808 family) [Rhodoplanes tepidamans]
MPHQPPPDPLRRALLGGLAGVAGLTIAGAPAAAQPRPPRAAGGGPVSAFGVDAATLGLRPGSPDDQTFVLQRALDRTAATGAPLALPPGVYRVGGVRLPDGARLVGTPGAVKLVFLGGASLLSADRVGRVALDGLVLDGNGRPLPENRALLHCERVDALAVTDCTIAGADGTAAYLYACAGTVADTRIADAGDVAIQARDSRGLVIARNVIAGAGNAGIQVLRFEAGEDGTLVVDNRLTGIRNRSGGTGQFGNAINVFRANGVIVRGNRIADCAFSGVRGNSASNLQIVGNTVTRVGETALYSEFEFEAAVIAGNIVDGAQMGVSVANYASGGRVAVVQGNILRNLAPGPVNPDPEFLLGVGISVEADTAVTGNVVERATAVGIAAGWGRYLRDVALTGNVVRECGIGIGVTVVPGARSTLVANNVISGSRRGAILGLDHKVPVTEDLAAGGAERYPHLSVSGNKVS